MIEATGVSGQLYVPARFCGPADSGNGGWVAGSLARLVDPSGTVSVRLHAPIPLERDLQVRRLQEEPPADSAPGRPAASALWDGETLLATARPGVQLSSDGPARMVGFDEAVAAAERYPGLVDHAYPTCFSCGTAREPGDGLRLHTGAVEEGLFATAWTPLEVSAEIVWAGLDCPGAWACGATSSQYMLLGTLAARIDHLPVAGQPHVVLSWPTGSQGRKHYSTCVLVTADGAVLARSESVWIVV